MKKKIVWLVVSCLMVTALLLTSCVSAAVEGEATPPEEVATPPIEEEEATPPEEVATPPIEEEEAPPDSPGEVQLPEPSKDSDVSIEEALLKRRSIRTYTGEALTLQEVSQLLWAAQGTTSLRGFRTAPSAAALYPLETYIVVGDVENLSEGVYRYETREHKYVHMEVGHAAQNVYLQAVSLGLGTVVIGGFSSDRAREILKLPENETLLYFMPVGRM